MAITDDIVKSITDQHSNMTRVFEALRTALNAAEIDINNRTTRILKSIEPISAVMEVNGKVAQELADTINKSLIKYVQQVDDMEALVSKILD